MAVDVTMLIGFVVTEGMLMFSAFMFFTVAAGVAIPVESSSFIVVSLIFTFIGPIGFGTGNESPRVMPRGFGMGTSVQCMQMSVTWIFATVVLVPFPRGGMVMLKGPNFVSGTCMQKLPPSIAMSP